VWYLLLLFTFAAPHTVTAISRTSLFETKLVVIVSAMSL